MGNAEHLDRAYRKLGDYRATAESDDGLITATVGPYGDLRGLDLDPRVYRARDAAALAAGILATVRAAEVEASRGTLASAAALLPDGVNLDGVDLVFDPLLYELDRLIGDAGAGR